MSNPYLEDFKIAGSFLKRKELVRKYAWAIPDENVIREIAKLSPIIEVGAGTGYWAKQLREAGADVLAFDPNPPSPLCSANPYHKNTSSWTEVQRAEEDIVCQYPDRTLFLCWPPYDDPMAARCLSLYEGQTLVYIGEGYGGCTGDDTFHEMLERDWDLKARIPIPRWFGISDSCWVYKRR